MGPVSFVRKSWQRFTSAINSRTVVCPEHDRPRLDLIGNGFAQRLLALGPHNRHTDSSSGLGLHVFDHSIDHLGVPLRQPALGMTIGRARIHPDDQVRHADPGFSETPGDQGGFFRRHKQARSGRWPCPPSGLSRSQ